MVLFERRNGPVRKAELLQAVWPALVVEDNPLQVRISALRKIQGPLSIATIPDRGCRFTAAPAVDDAAPALPSSPAATPHNLPLPRTRFIGRDATLAQCMRRLQDVGLLTLVGNDGCDRTRLALQLTHQLTYQQMSAFSDGVWFFDPAPLRVLQRVVATDATALGRERGRSDAADRPPARALGRPVRGHRAGQLRARDRRCGKRRRCAGLLVRPAEDRRHSPFAIRHSPFAVRHSRGAGRWALGAGRWALGVAGEQIVPSRPLSLPLAPGLTAMQASEAVRLFIDRASLAQPDFAIDAHNALAVVAICHRPDGIALYIELAAARASMLLVAKISARLSDSFRFPTGCRRAVPRHQTLQAALDWSHDTLPVAEQRLFRRLAVFAGRLHSGRRHRGCRCWRQVHGAGATC